MRCSRNLTNDFWNISFSDVNDLRSSPQTSSRLFEKNIMCYHHMMTVSIVNMTFWQHGMTPNVKIHKCQNVQICTIWQNRQNRQNVKKHHFGGVKNRHISACKSVNFGCSRPWKSRRIMYCLVYRHPPNFDQIGVYRKYGIFPKPQNADPSRIYNSRDV